MAKKDRIESRAHFVTNESLQTVIAYFQIGEPGNLGRLAPATFLVVNNFLAGIPQPFPSPSGSLFVASCAALFKDRRKI